MSNNSVSHYSDGRNAWKIGILGFLMRFKGIASTVAFTFVTMGFPWWWPGNIPGNISIKTSYTIISLIVLLGVLVALSLYYLRNRTIRSLDIKHDLHLFSHEIRNRQTELHEKLIEGKSYSKNKLNKELESLLKLICENAVSYFSKLTGDETIGAAIRLATLGDDKKAIVYKTYARSKSLNSHRAKNSEAIPIDKGIPRFLSHDKEAQGILIYHDLKEAEKDATYISTQNDRKYPDDVLTMMVSPLNAWSGKQQDMIGILYITSRKSNIFKVIHVDSLAFIADFTAYAIANTIELVRLKCNNPHLTKGEIHAQII